MTPDKHRRQNQPKNYDYSDRYTYAKTPKDDRYQSVSATLIDIDTKPKKAEPEEKKSTTPKQTTLKVEAKREPIEAGSPHRESYFSAMNKELSDKIEEIRQKYDKERQKLYQKYDHSDKKSTDSLKNSRV
jgi:hypothetical protein